MADDVISHAARYGLGLVRGIPAALKAWLSALSDEDLESVNELASWAQERRHVTHTTKDKRRILLKDLTNKHLYNLLRFCWRAYCSELDLDAPAAPTQDFEDRYCWLVSEANWRELEWFPENEEFERQNREWEARASASGETSA